LRSNSCWYYSMYLSLDYNPYTCYNKY
jgi:hypothetical protein